MKKTRSSRKGAEAFPIVAVVASAGGLDAFTTLLGGLPKDFDAALVFIQHLAADGGGSLPEILARATSLKVREARDADPVLAGHLYVIPPGMVMTLEDGRLRLRRRTASPGHNMVADAFLRSLAEERGPQSVAVVLSGAGSDGTLGAKAVKAAGGIVLAQDEESAAHESMPASAAAAGAVDLVLPPRRIAEELARIARHPWLRRYPAVVPDGESKALQQIFAQLHAVTGVDFSLYKSSTIWRRLSRRLVLHKLESLQRYAELLKADPREIQALHNDMLIHVTHFFRDPQVFALLRTKVFPRMLKNNPASSVLRVWVPGCATGEEAYSLAISLFEFLGDRAGMRQVQVFATDISEASIEKARAGLYAEGIHTDVPAPLLRRYFVKTERGYQVAKRVRDCCVFARQNLAVDPPFANMDLISCRNVLIYLGPELQKKVVPILHYALKPGGALLLGSAEAISGFTSLFSVVEKKSRLFFRKGVPSRLRPDFLSQPSAPMHETLPRPRGGKERGLWQESDAQKMADRILLAHFVSPGVVVNNELDILHFRGAIRRYLEPSLGRASLKLLKMLPDGCHAPLRMAVGRARKEDAPAREGPIELADRDGLLRRVTIEVVPFNLPVNQERHFLVLFHEAPAPAPKTVDKTEAGRSEARLKKELASTKVYLQSVVEEQEAATEELKAANEEIVSSNEELQSTNEELETAKEELQAANEELTTLNEELNARNTELSLANSDLVNLLASVHLAIVMLGNDLRIRRFTPLAERLMNLIPGDVGRPISDIKPRFDLPDIEEKVIEVIDTMMTQELEVRDHEGRWYSLRIRPYKTADSKIDGVVMVFVDIDAVKRCVLDVAESAALADALLDMAHEPLVVLDSDFRVTRATTPFLSGRRASLGRSFFEIDGGRWDRPLLREALAKLKQTGRFSGLSVTQEEGTVSVSACRVLVEGRRAVYVLALR